MKQQEVLAINKQFILKNNIGKLNQNRSPTKYRQSIKNIISDLKVKYGPDIKLVRANSAKGSISENIAKVINKDRNLS